ncbi:MAG: membrane protein insertase YidC, partial [Puniceicoccales bacterium]|nr:membrane protein insertase YidC [Puniceicoccales bacterium]
MEKKHLFFGVACILLAFLVIIKDGSSSSPKGDDNGQISSTVASLQPGRNIFAETANLQFRSNDGEKFVLENDLIIAKISQVGGGIDSIALKHYRSSLCDESPWLFDAYDRIQDALSLHLEMGGNLFDLRQVHFQPVSYDGHHLILRGSLPNGIDVEREYTLTRGERGGDAYPIAHCVRLVNGTGRPLQGKYLHITLGSLPPTDGDMAGSHLNFIHYNGKRACFIPLRKFASSGGFFGMGKRSERHSIDGEGVFIWSAIKNQFFAAILTPKIPIHAFQASPLSLEKAQNGEQERGIEGTVKLPVGIMESGQSVSLPMEYYVGPKEYMRLEQLGQRQDLVMQFGWFGWVSKLLLLSMKGIHSFLPNWGLAIVLLTICIKLLLWPLNSIQARSTRAMAKLQEPLKKIQEKYGNNRKKLQQETLRLFRENGVNPAAGCLPIFIQLPIFIGLYSMLQAASELRFASFLWIRDLSVADTVARCYGFPVNPLPFAMCIAMFLQMRMTPQATQNKAQKRIFQCMPIMLLFFCYRFPSGLVLYWTAQNFLSLWQQCIFNRHLLREEKCEGGNG